ncbi:MAG: hypothetical protein AAF196_03040 [Planctomycetota bacterium]
MIQQLTRAALVLSAGLFLVTSAASQVGRTGLNAFFPGIPNPQTPNNQFPNIDYLGSQWVGGLCIFEPGFLPQQIEVPPADSWILMLSVPNGPSDPVSTLIAACGPAGALYHIPDDPSLVGLHVDVTAVGNNGQTAVCRYDLLPPYEPPSGN